MVSMGKEVFYRPAPLWLVAGFTAYLGSRLYYPLPMTEVLDHWHPYIGQDAVAMVVVHEAHAEYGSSTTITATLSFDASLGVTT